MKKSPKKLTLSRETLGNLSEQQAKAIQGGGVLVGDRAEQYPWTSDSVRVCCA